MTTQNDAARPVKYWRFETCTFGRDVRAVEQDQGGYVLAADYDALREERDRIARMVDAVLADNSKFFASMEGAHREQHKLRLRAELAEAKLQSIRRWIAETQTKATALQCARNQTDRDTGHVIETMLGYVRAALNEGDGE